MRHKRFPHHMHGERDFGRHRSGFGPRGRGGPRARRGDVRAAILALLDEEPMHGYEMINRISEKTGGLWNPSPGSVYPTLQLLEETGLVEGADDEGKKRYSITDEGKQALADRTGPLPWDSFNEDDKTGHRALFMSARQLASAVQQTAASGSEEQRDRVREILEDARKKVYAILAE